MKTTRTIIYFRGVFTNLYEWGKGWKDSETNNKWNEYWRKYSGVHFHSFEVNKVYNHTWYLVGTGGGIYLHPMDFKGGLFDCGVKCNGRYFQSEIEEIYDACKECARYCGGEFEMYVSEEREIKDIEMEKIEMGEK